MRMGTVGVACSGVILCLHPGCDLSLVSPRVEGHWCTFLRGVEEEKPQHLDTDHPTWSPESQRGGGRLQKDDLMVLHSHASHLLPGRGSQL